MQPNGMVPRVYGDGHRGGYLRWYKERFLYNCEVSLYIVRVGGGGYNNKKGYRIVGVYDFRLESIEVRSQRGPGFRVLRKFCSSVDYYIACKLYLGTH